MIRRNVRKAFLKHALFTALLAAVAAVAALAVHEPVEASHTQVFFTPAGRVNPETVVMFINGPDQFVDFRVKDMDYPTGLGAYQFNLSYDPNVATVLDVTNGAFLGSSGRSTQCVPIPQDLPPGTMTYSCNTIGPGAPSGFDGPQGSGVLARMQVRPGAGFGFTPLTFTKTHLDDLTGDIQITHTSIEGSLLVAKCGDFNADNIISIGDMVQLITRFGTFAGPPPSANWDPRFDLNVDTRITVGDMLIEVQEFGRTCTA